MSGNLALVVDQSGTRLEKGTHETLIVTHADGRRERVGLKALGAVVLQGDVTLSTGLLQAFAANEIAFTTLPARGRAPAVELAPMPQRHVSLRHRQHLAYADDAQRLEFARLVVWAKLEQMAACAHEQGATQEDSLYRAMQAVSDAPDFAALMGIEGAATVTHFALLEARYQRDGLFSFNGRSRRPPRDAVNALMSLSYTLAQGQATQLAFHAGLDVQLGFLHALQRNRESLALDLIEPARAVLDDWVYDLLVHRRLLSPSLFTSSDQEGVRLDTQGRALFYRAWFGEGQRLVLKPMRRLLARLLDRLRAHESVASGPTPPLAA